jgi:hypothetical protein
MVTLIIALAPGISILLWLALECPPLWRRRILSIPSWLTSTVVGFIIMGISQGVMGVTVGFVTDVILTLGIFSMHKWMVFCDSREARKIFKERQQRMKYKEVTA